ncbi:MAG: hypothetical protein NXI10_08315 [bacterium]|nr:hypothetical protein [bacterium]
MRRLLPFCILLFLPLIGSTQIEFDTTWVDDEFDDNPVCGNVTKGDFVWFPDVEAQFPGGSDSLMHFIVNTLDYRSCELTDCELDHRVHITMIIQVDGTPCCFEIEKGSHSIHNEAVIDYFKKCPSWEPAIHRGVQVRSKVRVPIVFM